MLFADGRCAGCIIRNTLERNRLQEEGLQSALQRIDNTSLPPKRTLYRQDAPADALYSLRRGTVKLVRETPTGEKRIVRLLKAGDLAGLEALAGADRYRHTATAVDEVDCCRIPLPVVAHMEAAGRDFSAELRKRWQSNLDEADIFITAFASGTAEQRLARLLLKLIEQHSTPGCVSLTRSDIGAALGVSMETASRLMADFRRRGLIHGGVRSLECDAAALRDLANPR